MTLSGVRFRTARRATARDAAPNVTTENHYRESTGVTATVTHLGAGESGDNP